MFCCDVVQTKDIKGISIDLLIPGVMVNARVHSVLQNGIMLSFLTYFTGTVRAMNSLIEIKQVKRLHDSAISFLSISHFQVDIFHLQNPFSTKKWQDDYIQNKKVLFHFILQLILDYC